MSLRYLVFLLTALLFSASAAQAETFKYSNPKNGQYRLDYCFSWQAGCGQDAADAFCVGKGFESAQAFKVAKGIGGKSPTRTIGDSSICDSNGCDGFSTITCVKAGGGGGGGGGSATMKWLQPKVGGVRLDWCYSWQKGCGQKAADAFCEAVGYAFSDGFLQEKNVSKTRVISSKQVCDGNCDSFAVISCSK